MSRETALASFPSCVVVCVVYVRAVLVMRGGIGEDEAGGESSREGGIGRRCQPSE